ncbi:uncharacterized protein ASPGLDRAFT_41956 [Aspergillus glaucus CBS 516.65]|uniref:Uncharacterized protein n=1 Tax=Aspergillus glaucus CBS 516.65 TaxID=1160497 RepID=A0A1L9VWV0_ASPGL|nr:hypothetical protein ASPGLDRAFT_41956 [Aspergillus glaucus CBS 516.65]OJJ88390.1 hypothetical protein ASPGLDRAFT_41956 [Aspergillus glaucus CBS 516.65]
MAQRRYSNPVRYYSVPPTAIAPEPNTLMTTVTMPEHSPTFPTITSPRPSPPKQPQRTFILNHPPLGETERKCPHNDLTPIEGVSEIFRCDECWQKPELGWLWTCTQDVVGEDGLIDPKKCALLERKAYMSVLSGVHEDDNVKIMIKQRLALLSREEFHSPQNVEQGQAQDQRPKDEASIPERQKHVRQKSQRVRFAEENSYRSPSPPVYRDKEEDKSVEVYRNTVPEQQSVASDEDNHAEYIAWLNMITNMRNETSFGQLRPGVNTSQHSANTVQGVHAQQQQASGNTQVQANESQSQAIDRSYITRLRREMHSLDYHAAIADMHKTSRVSPQQLRARHQPEVSRSKSFRSHFQRSHQGSQRRDDENQIATPVPVRPASHDYSRQYQSPNHHTGRHEQQLSTHYHGIQSPPEMFRGRALSRSHSHPAREQPGHNTRKVPFVLKIHDPEENQNSTVQVAARAIGYIPKERLSPEYHSPPPAAPEQPSYRTTKPLPPPPPPPPPRRPRFLFPCGYKICSTCRGVRINEILPATRYNPEEELARPSAIVYDSTQQSGIPEQLIFFRPDFEDPSSDPTAKDGILMRDAQYFLARDNDPELRGLIASHIVNLGPSPAPADENLASHMEHLAVESLSGGSDNSTDESVDAVGQKFI